MIQYAGFEEEAAIKADHIFHLDRMGYLDTSLEENTPVRVWFKCGAFAIVPLSWMHVLRPGQTVLMYAHGAPVDGVLYEFSHFDPYPPKT